MLGSKKAAGSITLLVHFGKVTVELSAKKQAVVASVEDFDAVWDEFYGDYLASGAQDIIDERTEKWEQFFGDALFQP